MSFKLPPLKKNWIILLGLLLVGFLAMNLSYPKVSDDQQVFSIDTVDSSSMNAIPEQGTMKDYELHYEASLKEILEQIVGVGEVVVMVNLNSTEEKVYQMNVRTGTQTTEEKDHQGGNRRIDDSTRDEAVVTISSGSLETPVISKTLKPTVRGVVVAAEGADNPKVKSMISEVVQRMLDVPAHRISIVPKKISK